MAYPHDDSPIILHGAPDQSMDFPGAGSKVVQVMQLDMNNEVLEELLTCVRSGKQPHVSFGRNPMLRFGSHTHTLEARNSQFRHEIYKSNNNNNWKFMGLVSHSLSVRKAEDPSAGMDEALELLKSNMASLEQQREARKTLVTPELSAKRFGGSKPNSQSRLTSSHLTSTKPSFNDHDLTTKAMKYGEENKRLEKMQWALVHLLAQGPADSKAIAAKTHITTSMLTSILTRIAEKEASGSWILSNKAYKELDPWKFPYRSDLDRQSAIDNAIRAFDRQRIDPKDPVWQTLLPEEERGQGKTLSKLKLQPPKVPTPGLKPKVLDKKTGLPKRTEAKKSEKATEKAASTKEKSTNSTTSKAKDKLVNGTSKAEAEGNNRDTPKASQAKTAKSAKSNSQTSSSRATKEAKPSSAAKSLLNKPKNPSPLSLSPPVNASDFEDSHPVHKALAGAPSPPKSNGTKPLKRKLALVNGDSHRESAPKKAHLDTPNGTPKVKAANHTAPAKRRALDDSSSSQDNVPLKMRKLTNNEPIIRARGSPSTFAKTASSRPRTTHQELSDDSVTSPEYALSYRQRVDLAEKFKRYYVRYQKLYLEISGRKDPPSAAKRDELLKMHTTLADMKAQLMNGSIRG